MSRHGSYLLLLAFLILFLFRVRGVLPPFFLGLGLAYLSYPIMRRFEKRGAPRFLAIGMVYGIYFLLGFLLYGFFGPRFMRELEEVLGVLPRHTDRLEDRGYHMVQDFKEYPLPAQIKELLWFVFARLQGMAHEFAGRIGDFLLSTLKYLWALLLSPFLAFYLLRDGKKLRENLFSYVPKEYKEEFQSLYSSVCLLLDGFIRGQFFISFIMGILIFLGLSLVGIRYALFIGIGAGLFNVIPYFGPLIGIIPALLLALLNGPESILWVILVFFVANQLEANVLGPKIIGERVGLHPLTVIFFVLVGGELLGIVGMLLAVPLGASVKILLLFLLERLEGKDKPK